MTSHASTASNHLPDTTADPLVAHSFDNGEPTFRGNNMHRPLDACAAPAVPDAPLVRRTCPETPANPRWRRVATLASGAVLLLPTASFAQGGSPWEAAVTALSDSFTGPIARGLSLVAIVVGGIAFAFGEGGSKKLLAGIVFGAGMAIGAVNFMGWLFP